MGDICKICEKDGRLLRKLILSPTLDKPIVLHFFTYFTSHFGKYGPVSYDPFMVVSDDTVHICISHCFHARL